MKQPRLTTLRPRVSMASQRISARPKTADPYYSTEQHRACRAACWRCEWIDNGQRCEKSAANGDRMFADHIKERSNGGPYNGPGMCLCGAHQHRQDAEKNAPAGSGNRMAGASRGKGFLCGAALPPHNRNGPHREIMPRVRRFFKGTIH